MMIDHMTTYDSKIFHLGNSHAVRIPKRVLESLQLKGDEPVVLSVTEDGAIQIKKAVTRRYPTIQELFAGYTGDYQPSEWDTGEPVGRENE